MAAAEDVQVHPVSDLSRAKVQGVLRIVQECFFADAADLEDAVARDGPHAVLCGFYNAGECWVLALDHAVAMAAVQPTGLDKVPQMTVFNLCVLPEYRGRGMASRLLDACLALGVAHGSEILTGSVTLGAPGTDRLLAMYARYGAAADAGSSSAAARGAGSLRLKTSVADAVRRRRQRSHSDLRGRTTLICAAFSTAAAAAVAAGAWLLRRRAP